jgi:hypothetical protein
VYLLPLFLVLFWLNSVFPAQELLARYGSPFIISLTGWPAGIKGFSVTFVFLGAYLLSLICFYAARKIHFAIGRKSHAHCCRNI